ncbi:GntR family transcriptional regulator [Adlercreutzia equolifaciens]|uniref:GntR family transcriptional regulator n=2 Tax=Adlercreutzia TaxID=447020 RepID=A0A7K1T5L5_9ACTN|nr:GntR family transcriptional regulator [Adlercreutzia rubneri]MZG28043.1 PLP-dependent aminotransferase family protein [Adlercreutzia equolifaciens]
MLTYALNRTARESLYEQLYRALRLDIESGALGAGDRLPSKRAFAKHLGVSVVTVEGAYDQLVAEGYVRAVPRSGFYVQEIGPNLTSFSRISTSVEVKVPLGDSSGAKSASCRPEARISGNDGVEKLEKLARKGAPFCIAHSEEGLAGVSPGAGRKWLADFTGAMAPEGVFPYAAWARTLRRVLADESERTVLEASGPQGSPRLRAAIAAHLRGFRGMEVHPDQIVIGSGAQSLYGLLVQLLGRNLAYGVEDPGYPRLTRIYESNDVAVRPIALDGEGPVLEALERARIDVLHCTPSHQFPTGITVPVSRRRSLLEWAQSGVAAPEDGAAAREIRGRSVKASSAQSRYLIEDDFDCEFRMAGRPVPPLAALDGAGRVIYANTFSKTLGGAFRIGYMVLPEALAERFRDRLGFYACTVGALEQLTLARFMESGDYERHVNRQRTRYRRRLSALIDVLAASSAGDHLHFANAGAGLHFLMEVRSVEGDERDSATFEERVARRAAIRGVRLAPLGRYRFTGCEAGAPGRSSNETVGCRCEAREVEGARRVCDEVRSGCSEGRGRRRPAFVMSFSSLEEETIPEVAGIVSEAVMVELG